MFLLNLIFLLHIQAMPAPHKQGVRHEICPGATHFYSGKKKPYWTKTLVLKCKIGDHYFYGKGKNDGKGRRP
jgi:hypothetical protein